MIISAEILEDIEKLDPSTRGIFIKLFREIEKKNYWGGSNEKGFY